MNNNKKYKKWSLGLVAPALVLAPIAVVASCSSSGEEKEAYAIKFTTTDQIKATTHKTVQPKDLTNDQFKDEVLNHLSELFSVDGKLPAEDFISKNIEISELKPSESDDKKEVSAKVKVNNANTSGESIEKTITLTGLGYEEVDLTKLVYTIALKENNADPQEIELSDQTNNSTDTINAEKLMELVLVDATKEKILEVSGDNADQITNEILANQILKVSDLDTDKTEGKVTFKLSIEKPVNGAGDTLEKTITFTGFKQETDSTPESKNIIAFKAKTDGKYVLKTVSGKPADEFGDIETEIKPLIIQEKDVIFEATEGTLPTEEQWWNDNLLVSEAGVDAPNGEITVTIQLNNANSTDSSAIKEENVVLAGFQPKPAAPTTGKPTTIKTEEVSTVTLGLNGSLNELTAEVNEQWIADKKEILFQQGFEPITADAISSVRHNAITGQNGKFSLVFKVEAGKYFGDDGNLAADEKEFTITIKGISSKPTLNTPLKNKSGNNPLQIGLVDPVLAEKTYEEYKNDSANIFNKSFVFKYRKHLLTGDFTQVDQAGENGFLKAYTGNQFVKVVPNDTDKSIEIKFTILKDKIVPAQNTDTEYTIKFTGFKTK